MAALVFVSKQIEHFEYRKDLPRPVHRSLLQAKLLPRFSKKDIHLRLAPAQNPGKNNKADRLHPFKQRHKLIHARLLQLGICWQFTNWNLDLLNSYIHKAGIPYLLRKEVPMKVQYPINHYNAFLQLLAPLLHWAVLGECVVITSDGRIYFLYLQVTLPGSMCLKYCVRLEKGGRVPSPAFWLTERTGQIVFEYLYTSTDNEPLMDVVEVVLRESPFVFRVINFELEIGWHISRLDGRQVCANDLGFWCLIGELDRPNTCACPNIENPSWRSNRREKEFVPRS